MKHGQSQGFDFFLFFQSLEMQAANNETQNDIPHQQTSQQDPENGAESEWGSK